MLGGIFDKNKIKEKIQTFDNKIAEENFWKDKSLAQKILKEKSFLDNIFSDFNSIVNELDNLEQLFELASKENDTAVIKNQKNTYKRELLITFFTSCSGTESFTTFEIKPSDIQNLSLSIDYSEFIKFLKI